MPEPYSDAPIALVRTAIDGMEIYAAALSAWAKQLSVAIAALDAEMRKHNERARDE